MTKKKKKDKLEKFVSRLTVFTVMFVFVSIFFFKSQLSSVNIEVEKMKKQITKQEKVNESLTMKVNELVSLENMQNVASNNGLEYNNNNILVVNK